LAAAIFGLASRPNRQTLVREYSTKSTTFSRSGVSASAVIDRSTWLLASTGTLVSWLTNTGCSFTPSNFAYSLLSIQAGPDQASPAPLVFSASHGRLASTPTRSTPAFLMASTRALAPGAGASCADAWPMPRPVSASAAAKAAQRRLAIATDFIFLSPELARDVPFS
jgi:hypothetical protein